MHQVGDQPRLYYDARSANHQDRTNIVLYQNFLLFVILYYFYADVLTILVLMWNWFIVWLLIVFSYVYSHDMLYIQRQCALRTDESEILYICMYVCMYVKVKLEVKFTL